MKTFNQKIALLLLLSLGLISCTKNDSNADLEDEMMEMGENPQNPIDNQQFSANINGEAFNPPNLFVAASVVKESGFYAIGIAAVTPTSTNTGKGIALAMVGLNFDELEAGKEWDLSTEENTFHGASGEYTQNGFETDEIQEIRVILTAIDKQKRIFSGEFRFVAIDEDSNTVYTISDGVFTDLVYDEN